MNWGRISTFDIGELGVENWSRLAGADHRHSLVFENRGNATVDKLIAECTQRLPADSEHPAKPMVLQEINALWERLSLLKQSIGQG